MNVGPTQANSTVSVMNLDLSRPSGDLARLAANLEVVFGGAQWTPAVSNGFSQFMYLFMASVQDSYQDPISNSLQAVTVDNATLVGPGNRRLLQQVDPTQHALTQKSHHSPPLSTRPAGSSPGTGSSSKHITPAAPGYLVSRQNPLHGCSRDHAMRIRLPTCSLEGPLRTRGGLWRQISLCTM